MVLLHVTAVDADGRVVLDYYRCPLLPARSDDPSEAGDDVRGVADRAAQRDVHELIPVHWRLDGLRREPLGTLFGELRPGESWSLEAGETVTSAPELARVSLNLAMTWRSCDHLGPTFEGDLLHSEVTLEELAPLDDGGLVHARIVVAAQAEDDDDPRPVLDWRLTGLMP